jgi:spermidine synthase
MLYVAVTAWCAVDLLRKRSAEKEILEPLQLAGRRAVPPAERIFWLSLAACGSVVLLATTNQMCQNVAVVPFLWVLPLALYLLSFIICFDHERWYDRRFWIPGMLVSFAAVAILLKLTSSANIYIQIFIYSVTLFTGCMVCHGELARAKPPPARLTSFYLMVAAGGALGGVFVTLLAPLVFDGFWEFPLALFGCYVLAAISVLSDLSLLRGKRPWYVHRARHLWATGATALILVFGSHIVSESANTLAMVRSFYGVLRVYEGYKDTTSWRRHLWNGDISHGCQFMDDALRRLPTHYYGFTSGVALAIDNHPRREAGLNIGIVGLGAGTLAVYGRVKDTIRFYEINPDVVDVAGEFFTFLEDSWAEVEIALGDARMAMERELRENGPQRFDVLALDAFASDAIPIHLLTQEAFDVYREHLAPGGVLAVHISNHHFNLEPLMRGLARKMGQAAVLIVNEENDENEVFMSDWVLITSNEELIANPAISEAVIPWDDEAEIVWTDDYANLLGVLFD